jgi:hypothetical protein
MKTFKEFRIILNERLGDFGSPSPIIKPNCYGKVIKYKMAKGGKACAKKRTRE